MSTLSLSIVALAAALTERPPFDDRVELVRLSDGVYAAVRKEPLGLAVNSNSLIVVGDRDVLVVDAQFTREATLETLAAIRTVTALPVRYVVNTHWHDDHVAGNQVYRDSFPEARFIAHANTRTDLSTLGAQNRIATRDGAPPLADRYDRLLADGLGVDSTPASDRERESLTSALRIIRTYLAELPAFRETLEGPSVQDRLRVVMGKHPVDIRWLGRGNTRGDLIVHLPEQRIVATGDLLVAPVPFAFGSYPDEWTTVLDSVAALRPRAIVPGHGPVMRDLEYLRRVRSMLGEVHARAAGAALTGDSLSTALRTITLESQRRAMTADEKWMDYMFNRFFLRPAITSAHQQALARRGSVVTGLFVLTNVNVIPMTSDTVLRGATILVRNGRIAGIGRDIQIPAGARRIDGRGRFVIPGLADMHAHLYSDDEAIPDSAGPLELGVMLANGITTARLMIGTPAQLTLRRQVASGMIPGPQLFVASPHLTGRAQPNAIVVTDPDSARAAVRRAADAGYDQIKITLFITRPVYDAIVDEAAKRRIRVVGHVDPQVGVARALETGQQLEHLDSYFEAALADSAPMKMSVTQMLVFNPNNWKSLDYIDDRKLDSIAGATARAQAWSSPTLNVFNTAFAAMESDEEIRSRPDWNMIPPSVREPYLRARARYWSPETMKERTEARRRRYVEVRNRLVRAIHDSGGRILAGSDTPEWFHVYGWGLHREIHAYVDAGLTPYEALATATRNPAEFLNQSAEWGTLEPGKRADFVVLSANPLDDIRNTFRIEGVGIGGRWLQKPELDRMIQTGSRAINGAAPSSQ